jgi:hypothetical protein
MKVHAKNVLVSGTPGARSGECAGVLSRQGWQILWPDQDLDIYQGQEYLAANSQNIEVENIHRCIESDLDTSRFSARLPDYYTVPYPGPAEFISKFQGQPAVITGLCLAPCLDLWRPAARIVVDIQATMAEDLRVLREGSQGHFADDQLVSIRSHQLAKYRSHLKLFPEVFTMTNAEVSDGRFDGLSDFLNSVF